MPYSNGNPYKIHSMSSYIIPAMYQYKCKVKMSVPRSKAQKVKRKRKFGNCRMEANVHSAKPRTMRKA